MRTGYDAALSYTKQRFQFGKPLVSFQIVQQRLVRMLAELTGMQLEGTETMQTLIVGRDMTGTEAFA